MDKLSAPSWRKISKNAWITRLGADLPEILLLVLSEEESRKIRASDKATKKHLERLFKKKLNAVAFRKFPPVPDKHGKPSRPKPRPRSVIWFVPHRATSATLVIPSI
jgi:hypothetical protein